MRAAILLVIVLGSAASAADSIATWSAGPGTIAGTKAAPGDAIAADVRVIAGDRAAHVALARAPKCSLYLSAGGELSLASVAEGAGESLTVTLVSGQLEADIADKGPYASVHVRGAVMDVKVTGTLFVVERVKKDTDYVALIRGKVQVNMRKDLGEALAALGGAGVDLNARQGLSAGLDGLGAIEQLLSRPQIHTSSLHQTSSLQGQGGAPGPESSWVTSDAADSFAGGPVTPPELPVGGVETPPADLGDVGGDIQSEIDESIQQDIQSAVTTEVVNQAFSGPNPISPPPGPP
jgi:hypothetical protein